MTNPERCGGLVAMVVVVLLQHEAVAAGIVVAPLTDGTMKPVVVLGPAAERPVTDESEDDSRDRDECFLIVSWLPLS